MAWFGIAIMLFLGIIPHLFFHMTIGLFQKRFLKLFQECMHLELNLLPWCLLA